MRLALFGLLILAACSKSNGGGDGGALAIPGDLPFDEKALPVISDADLAEAKALSRTLSDATAPFEILLVKKDESDGDKIERRQKLAKLRPDLRALVEGWQAQCPSQDEKTESNPNGKPATGAVFNTKRQTKTTGAACPVAFTENLESTVTITEFTPPSSGALNIVFSGSGRGVYNDAVQHAMTGARALELSFSGKGRYESTGQVTNSYTEGNGTGMIDLVTQGMLTAEFKTRQLERKEANKELNTHVLKVAGKVFTYTQYLDQTAKVNARTRYFIGHRELTREEVIAMGEFPFSIEKKTVMTRAQRR